MVASFSQQAGQSLHHQNVLGPLAAHVTEGKSSPIRLYGKVGVCIGPQSSVSILNQQLNFNPNVCIIVQAIWALGNIAGDGPELRDLLLNNGLMVPLLEILASDVKHKPNAAWALSNLCRGRDPLPDPEMVRH